MLIAQAGQRASCCCKQRCLQVPAISSASKRSQLRSKMDAAAVLKNDTAKVSNSINNRHMCLLKGDSSSTTVENHSADVEVTALENFNAMCTLLGGINNSCYRGYVGTWTSFIVPDYRLEPVTDAIASSGQTATEAAAAGAAAVHTTQPVYEETAVNFRLFRMEDPSTSTIHQVNMYEGGGRPAAAGYKPYMSHDANACRPDGYGVREWRHDPTGTIWSPDGSAWRSPNAAAAAAAAAQKVLLGIAVADCGMALVNGALPSNSPPKNQPLSWHMEVMFKQPGSYARRWGILQRYDCGRLANIKAINEDHTELQPDELHSCFIDPGIMQWQPRKQGPLGDIDNFAQQYVSQHGTAVVFTYDDQHQLTAQTANCTWSSRHMEASQRTAAATTAGSQSNIQLAPVLAQIELPDWSYCRVPWNIPGAASPSEEEAAPAAAAATAATAAAAAAAAAAEVVTFELGTVLTDGSLARWLLDYHVAGSRLLHKAKFELYPAL